MESRNVLGGHEAQPDIQPADTAPGGSSVKLENVPGTRTWLAKSASREVALRVAKGLDALEREPSCTIIKKNMVRAVYRLRLNGDDLIVKHFFRRNMRDTLKHLIIPDKGSVEWKVARRMEDAGIPVPTMIACGLKRSGPLFHDAAIVMEAIPDSINVNKFLQDDRPATGGKHARQRHDVLVKIAEICEKMHRNGIYHSDFHGGNLLATAEPDGSVNLHVVDLHSVKFPRVLKYKHRVETLSFIIDALQRVTGLPERREIVMKYAAIGGMSEDQAEKLWKDVRHGVKRRERHRTISRTDRCLKNTSHFVKSKRAGYRISRKRTLDENDVLASVAEHHKHLDADDDCVVHRSNGGAVTRLESGLCVKEWRPRGFFDWLRGRLFGTKARAAWFAANGLRVRMVPTAPAVALAESQEPLGSSYLITQFLDNAKPLNVLLNEMAASEVYSDLLPIAGAVGESVGALHAQGVHHHDLSTKNILIERAPGHYRARIIDLDNIRFWQRLSHRRQFKGLSQLNDLPEGTPNAARLAFLRRYNACQLNRISRADVEKIAQLTQKRASARDFRPPQ